MMPLNISNRLLHFLVLCTLIQAKNILETPKINQNLQFINFSKSTKDSSEIFNIDYQKPSELINKFDSGTHETNHLNCKILTIGYQYN